MFISQHHNTPGLHAMSRDVLPMWRRAASERGCKFFGFTLVRDPLERAISDFYFSNHKPEGLAVALEIPQYDNGITRQVCSPQPHTVRADFVFGCVYDVAIT